MSTTTMHIGTNITHVNNDTDVAKKTLKQSQPDNMEEWETRMISRIGDDDTTFIHEHRKVVHEWYTRNEFNELYVDIDEEDENPFTSMTYEQLKRVYMDMGALKNDDEVICYFSKLLEVRKDTLEEIERDEDTREYYSHCVFPNSTKGCECPECHGSHGLGEDGEVEGDAMCEDCMDGATGDCGWCTFHKYTCGKN
jgi:hypothetical protein